MDKQLKQAVRAAFERAAPDYDDAAVLQKEVARRLDERLEMMKFTPATVLDAGCGTGFGLPLLRARYPDARLLALDLAHGMLRETLARHGAPAGWRGWLSRLTPNPSRLTPICADLERLPLKADSLDLLWSNLTLQWMGDLEATVQGLHRVIRPGGLLMFSTFGPDTLKELRAAFAGLDDGHGHVNRFTDMHDIGDLLVHAGFTSPVMEMEYLTLTYADLHALLRDLKAIGAHTVLDQRRAGLMGKTAWRRLAENYEHFRRDGRLPATYEVIYGHAWAGRKDRLADGRQVIELKIGRKREMTK
jgi:malonyl-CoA O-methyltransferase